MEDTTMEHQMICNYRHDAEYRKSFNALAKKTFWIDFEKWYELGFWNDRYICYSLLDQDQVIANVSANLLNWVFEGKRLNAIQIGTVMTHPDYRKRGLASQLMHHVLSTYEQTCDLFYLFGEPSVKSFYEGFGFVPIQETLFTCQMTVNGEKQLRKLNLDEDIDTVRRLTAERQPLSEGFWVDNAQAILAWHLINVYPDDIYYIEQMDAIVLFKTEGDVIRLYDVICPKPVKLEDIVEYIAPKGNYTVEFNYTPPQNVSCSCTPYHTDDYIFFVKVKKGIMLPDNFFHPVTAHA